jgi:hypothetical protein
VRPPVVLRSSRRAAEPATGAVTLRVWVAEAAELQPPEASTPLGDGVTVKVPEEGVTVTPPGLGTACQCTVAPSLPLGTRPRAIAVGFPTVNVVAPLGTENPTAGS